MAYTVDNHSCVEVDMNGNVCTFRLVNVSHNLQITIYSLTFSFYSSSTLVTKLGGMKDQFLLPDF